MSRRRSHAAATLALGLLHGAADALPVSSSGHMAAAEALLGTGAGDPVGLHAGSLAAVVVAFRGQALEVLRRLTWRRVGMHLAAGAIPAAAGYGLERRTARLPVAPGMLAGAGLLLAAERRCGARSRWDAGVADGVWLGLAQAAALWPGVSRNGATLAAARLLGFAPTEANPLSREVGAPVTLGAVLLRRAPVDAGVAASFAGVLAALPLVRAVDRGGPLWPWAAERAAVALVVLRSSRA
ncbi:MAG: undecaprenyl-diphosphatase [Solirubrobacteraceae bacterium]|nr:undecaprenyl-diphosphatase [Solirubrobacteraceae bacterium]